jgi:hypothetical protein
VPPDEARVVDRVDEGALGGADVGDDRVRAGQRLGDGPGQRRDRRADEDDLRVGQRAAGRVEGAARERAARAIEPPISPTPRTATRGAT